MNLHDLRSAISGTVDDDWNLIELDAVPGADARSVPASFEIDTYHRAVLTSDVSAAIEWGKPGQRVSDDDLTLDDYGWAARVPWADRRVAEELVDVYFGASLVDRVTILVVDGYRAHLPIPRVDGDHWVVDSWHVAIARLVDILSGHTSFERYLGEAGVRFGRP
ncbi:hypothetical protein [Galbitalea soli]|uniref:Uncharacterized protein n=1 Tax=Galbitalea soli TaxID=1268042 RepID=A0A7C9TMV2_9MICO|nr:hypothetical protein [Galbitalea soli]NEM89795.1 hypothetical protein [Galbitalea soli]NYJ30499.1 hypothetical protein [Galbitalea soli]